MRALRIIYIYGSASVLLVLCALQLKKMERNREQSNQLMFEAVMNDDALAFRQSIQDGAEVRVHGLSKHA